MSNAIPQEIQFLQKQLSSKDTMKMEMSTDFIRQVLSQSTLFLARHPLDALKPDFDRDLKRLGVYLEVEFRQTGFNTFELIRVDPNAEALNNTTALNMAKVPNLSHQLTLLSNAFHAAAIALREFTLSRFPQNKGTKSNPLRFKDIAKRVQK